ncbi:MAG: hypothetical protein ACLQVX_23185 [Limisphaerales bacterium]
MYVAPTPFGLTTGTARNQTLILPGGASADARFVEVGRLVRNEADKLIVGYTFDSRTNTLTPRLVDNPSAGKEHVFRAYRLKGVRGDLVAMRPIVPKAPAEAEDDEGNE